MIIVGIYVATKVILNQSFLYKILSKMKISFLASHGGTAVRHIIAAIANNQLQAEIGVVITNNSDSAIYNWCNKNAVDAVCINGNTHSDELARDKAIYDSLVKAETDLIILSGYMKKIGRTTLAGYSNRILNIHPSLLPKHGGKGLYGDRVHQSVIDSGDKQSGATVQFINEEYDEGPIFSQQIVEVEKGETVETLKSKVQAIEGELYLTSIRRILDDGLLHL